MLGVAARRLVCMVLSLAPPNPRSGSSKSLVGPHLGFWHRQIGVCRSCQGSSHDVLWTRRIVARFPPLPATFAVEQLGFWHWPLRANGRPAVWSGSASVQLTCRHVWTGAAVIHDPLGFWIGRIMGSFQRHAPSGSLLVRLWVWPIRTDAHLSSRPGLGV